MINYEIKTGKLVAPNIVGTGYSGHGDALNDETKTNEKGKGPIPKGLWHLTTWEEHHPHLGDIVIHLMPDSTTETFGRSAFFIHGDNQQMNYTASDGCIILSKDLREKLKDSGETKLLVT